MIFSSPAPQLGQRCRSMSNTRLSSRAQPMCCARACTGCASPAAGPRAAGPCGTTRARSFAWGASSERWVESVLLAAQAFSSRHRTQFTPDGQWWIESADVDYAEYENDAIESALEALQELDPTELATHCRAVAPFLVPSERMVVVEREATLISAAKLAKTLVDDPKLVQLLVPAKLPKRLTPAERERRDSLARRKAEAMGVPYSPEKPRRSYEQGIEFDGSDLLVEQATKLGLSIALHGRTAGAREGPHDWRRAGSRLAVRIKENGYDRVRSAKVFARVLATAIVSCDAGAMAKDSAAG